MTDCSETCISVPNPCEIFTRAYNALINRTINGATTGYRVGEESYQFSHLSLPELRSFVEDQRALCVACGGNPPPIAPQRRRASVCFVFGSHRCRMCRRTACGCPR